MLPIYLTMTSKEESAWRYSPNDRLGDAKFDGLPCPTKEAVKKIGIEGVNRIDPLIKEMIECKKKIYGVDSKLLGFFPHMAFFNTETKQSVGCKEQMFIADDLKRFYAFPERAVPGNYTIFE